MSSFVRRLFMNAVPFAVMAVVVCMAIFGDHGLIRRHHMKVQSVEVLDRIGDVERENAVLRRQIRLLDSRQSGIQRLAAEEMYMAPPGSTIYRFGPAESE